MRASAAPTRVSGGPEQEGSGPPARVPLHRWREDPDRYEEIVRRQIEEADSDPRIAATLRGNYIHRNPDVAFEEYRASLEFQKVLRLLGIFGVNRSTRICEIGGGPGFVTWALARAGFENLCLVEPNGHYHTGTGYLRQRLERDGHAIEIVNDLDRWYSETSEYDLILTRNCIHHFPNIAFVAAAARAKLADGGRWFAWREQYAEDTEQLLNVLGKHPYAAKFGLYEFAYPAGYYEEAFRFAGYRLAAVVPAGYANNALIMYQPNEGDRAIQAFTAKVEQLLARTPRSTVRRFHLEIFTNRYMRGILGPRRYGRPAGLLFERAGVATAEL